MCSGALSTNLTCITRARCNHPTAPAHVKHSTARNHQTISAPRKGRSRKSGLRRPPLHARRCHARCKQRRQQSSAAPGELTRSRITNSTALARSALELHIVVVLVIGIRHDVRIRHARRKSDVGHAGIAAHACARGGGGAPASRPRKQPTKSRWFSFAGSARAGARTCESLPRRRHMGQRRRSWRATQPCPPCQRWRRPALPPQPLWTGGHA